jgi:hypothetical protein
VMPYWPLGTRTCRSMTCGPIPAGTVVPGTTKGRFLPVSIAVGASPNEVVASAVLLACLSWCCVACHHYFCTLCSRSMFLADLACG